MAEKTSKKVIWIVGFFRDTKEYSVIPLNWLHKPIGIKVGESFTKWPPYAVTSSHLQEAVDPSDDWESYRITILNDGKTYVNFNKAWHSKIKIKLSSTETEQDDVVPKKRPLFENNSSDESDNFDSYTIKPLMKPSSNNFISMSSVSSNENKSSKSAYNNPIASNNTSLQQLSTHMIPLSHNNLNYQSDVTEMPLQSLYYTPQNNYIPAAAGSAASMLPVSDINTGVQNKDQSHSRNLISPALETRSETLQPTPPSFESDIYTPNNLRYGLEPENNTIMEILNKLCKEQATTHFILNRILAKVELLDANLKIKNHTHVGQIMGQELDESFMLLFPIKNEKEFSAVELQCKETIFVLKLESYIKSIGGSCPKNHLNRVLSKILTDEFGIRCSITGRGKEVTTKVGDSRIVQITKKVIKETSKNLFTDSDFEKVLSDWLRHANTRFRKLKTTSQ